MIKESPVTAFNVDTLKDFGMDVILDYIVHLIDEGYESIHVTGRKEV